MSPGDWINAVVAVVGLAALWVRLGRILQRIDDFSTDQAELKRKVGDHETRLVRTETRVEGLCH